MAKQKKADDKLKPSETMSGLIMLQKQELRICLRCRFVLDSPILVLPKGETNWVQKYQCRRFPETVLKNGGDWCGEYKGWEE